MSIRIIIPKQNNRPKSSDGVAARGLVNGRSRTVHENVRWTFESEQAAGVGGIYRTELFRSSYIRGIFADNHLKP